MKKYILGVLFSLCLLISPVFTPPVEAAGLTPVQVSAIISLLQAFGADQSVIANVQTVLGGGTSNTSLTALITINGQPSVTNADPLVSRTWAWSGTPGSTYSASGNITGCENTSQNGPQQNWEPWTDTKATGNATNGSSSVIPGAVKYGCVIVGTYNVTKDGKTTTATATITYKHANGSANTAVVDTGSNNSGGLAITTNSLHFIQSGSAWYLPLTYTGAVGTPAWSLVSGSLPATMELDPVKGVISNGKVFNTSPIEVNNNIPKGTYTFTVKVTVGSQSTTKQLSLEVNSLSDKRLTILQSIGSSFSPRRIAVDQYLDEVDYSLYFVYMPWTENEDKTVGDKCSFVSGQLPPGLSIGPSIRGCRITGVPTTEGTYTFTFKIENEFGSDTGEWTLEAYTPAATLKPIVGDTLPAATVGEPYNFKINLIQKGMTASQISGSRFGTRGGMPPGLTIDDITGVISGTPTEAGTYIPTINYGVSTFAFISGMIQPTFVVKPRTQTLAQLNASIMTAWTAESATSFMATMVQNGWTLGDVTTATGRKMSDLADILYPNPSGDLRSDQSIAKLNAISVEAAKIINTFDWSEANKHQSALSFRTIMIQKGITLEGVLWGYFSLSGYGVARNEIVAVVNASSTPTLTSLSPSTGKAGTTVTINGSGFTGTNNVYIKGILIDPATVSSSGGLTPTWISFVVPSTLSSCFDRLCTPGPALTPGTYTVSVQNTNGTSNALSFGVN